MFTTWCGFSFVSNCLGFKRASVLLKPTMSSWMHLQQWWSNSFILRAGWGEAPGELGREVPQVRLGSPLCTEFILLNNTYCPRLLLYLCLSLLNYFPFVLFLGCFHWIWRKCDQATSKGQLGMVHHWFCRAFGRTGRIRSVFIQFITTSG